MEEIMDLNERLMKQVIKKFAKDKKSTEFRRIKYHEAMNLYGSDKPDLRFDLEMTDLCDEVKGCEFKVFSETIKNGGAVKALNVKGGAKFTRSQLDDLETLAKENGAKGLAYLVIEDDGSFKSPIVKFFKKEELDEIIKKCKAKKGDVVFFAADKWAKCCNILGIIRLKIADYLKLKDENVFAFCWVTHFPLFEYKEEEKKLDAVHHPFTAPVDEHKDILEKDPANILSKSYDIVLNGVEIGGGSIRIYDQALQARIFKILGISDEDASLRFGHMLKAFTFGAPPHGGIAWGLDRFVMILQGEPNIREVIPFPKDQKARDLMLGAPSPMPASTLAELHIKNVERPVA